MTSGAEVWEHIFEQYPVLSAINSEGAFPITSSELNKISKPLYGPDARNLVKYDHEVSLPPAFRRHNLALLPVGRGDFLIGPYKIYAPLPDKDFVPVRTLEHDDQFESLERISSENDALMVAYYGGAVSRALSESVQYTGGGKLGGPAFDMRVGTSQKHRVSQEISVKKGVSIEIDALYEGASLIAAFEAKMKSVVDFNVRQLYYPFRALSVNHSKPVRTVFLTYSNEIFDLREFTFIEPDNMSSFRQLSRFRFTRAKTRVLPENLKDLSKALSKLEPEPVPYPFPQADSMERILNLVELLLESPLTKRQISEAFGFHERQADYYANAAGFLGIAARLDKGLWVATGEAKRIFALAFRERNVEICGLILRHKVFRSALNLTLDSGRELPKRAVEEILADTNQGSRMAGSTLPRRVGTVLGWVRWMQALADA